MASILLTTSWAKVRYRIIPHAPAQSSENRAELTSGAVLIAFALAIFHDGAGGTLGILALVSMLLLIGVWRAIGPMRSQQEFCWSNYHWVALLFAVALAANVATSTLRENSFYFALTLAAISFSFFIAASLTDEQRNRYTRKILALVTFSAAWGVSEHVVTLARANGPIIDPNAWASLHNLAFFALLATVARAGHMKAIDALSLLLLALAVATSSSRVAAFVMFAGLVFLLISSLLARSYRRLVAIAVTICLTAFVATATYSTLSGVDGRDITAVGAEESGWQQRLSMWRGGLKISSDYPFFGSGLGTFKVHYPRYR